MPIQSFYDTNQSIGLVPNMRRELALTLVYADNIIPNQSYLIGKRFMRYRIIIVLTLFAIFGFYTQQASASSCSARHNCMPPLSSGHTGGAGDQDCGCPPGNVQLLGHFCGASRLLRGFPQLILPSDTHQPVHYDAGQPFSIEANISTNPMAFAHGRCINLPPLSYPIYLQTLALLC